MKHQILAYAGAHSSSANAPGGNGAPPPLLCDGLQNIARQDAAEQQAWADWAGQRVSVKAIFGEGLMAAAAWECVAAVDALQQGHAHEAIVSVVGTNQQALAARFAAEPTGQSPVPLKGSVAAFGPPATTAASSQS